MIVDVHAHYYPISYLERIGRTDVPPLAAAPLHSQGIDERLHLLDRLGIDVQVLSVSQAQPYLSDPGDAAEAATMANDLFIAAAEQHRDRFQVFAALPLPHTDQALAEIYRVRGSEHAVGFTIGCSIGSVQLDDPVLDPVLQRLDEVGAVVFLHPIGQEDTTWLAGRNLAWMVGAPFEDTAAALRLVLAGVPWRYPGIRFIVPHLGGTLPFLLARVGRKREGEVDVAAGLRTMFYDTVSGSKAALACACSELGAHRLMFGTDYPYCDAEQFEHHLTYLQEADLDDDTLEEIRGTTAADLLGLRPAPSRPDLPS